MRPTFPLAAILPTLIAFCSLFFKYKYEDLGESRAPNVTCFSFILLFSLTGALGLAIRATSGSGFCEKLLSSGSEGCVEAGLVMAMSWTCVVTGGFTSFAVRVVIFLPVRLAIVGILVSSLDKYPGALEATRLYAPQRSTRDLELLKRPAALEAMNTPPRIHVPRPPPASYEAAPSRQRADYMKQIRSLVPAQSFPRLSQRFSSHKDSPSPPKRNERPLMLHRKINGPARDRSLFTRIDDLSTPPDNTIPIRLNAQKADGRDLWKQKYVV